METKKINCKNCEIPFDSQFQFCPHCGQKSDEELTITVLFYNTISNYFSFDARFLKSFFPLLFKPGYLARKFLEGKRLLYLHPAQMYLFISVVFFFIISFSTRELVQEADKINEKVVKSELVNTDLDTINKSIDSLELEKLMKPLKNNPKVFGLNGDELKRADSLIRAETANRNNLSTSWSISNLTFNKKKIDSLVASGAEKELIYKEIGISENPGFWKQRIVDRILDLMDGKGLGAITQAFFDSIPISMFFLLPLFALFLKIFYYNKGKYSHHLVFSFYFFCFLFTVFSILFAVNRFLYDIPDGIDWIIAISTYFYFFIALKRFYEQHWFLTWIKSGIISFVFILFVIPSAAGLVLAFSFLTS